MIITFYLKSCIILSLRVKMFFLLFENATVKDVKIAIYFVKTILYGLWTFRNKATFRNGSDTSDATVNYISGDIKIRLNLDYQRLSPNKFGKVWGELTPSYVTDNFSIY